MSIWICSTGNVQGRNGDLVNDEMFREEMNLKGFFNGRKGPRGMSGKRNIYGEVKQCPV